MANEENSASKTGVAVKSNGIFPFENTVAELKKVYRPTKEETVQASIHAFSLIVIISVFLGSADAIIGWLMSYVYMR